MHPVLFISHVSTESPVPQRFVPAVHASVQVNAHAPATQAFGEGHPTGSDQSLQPDDCTWQVCTLSPEQRVVPDVVQVSLHVVAHAPPLQTVVEGQGSGAESVGQPLTRTHSRT